MRVITSGVILNENTPEDITLQGERRRRLLLLWLDVDVNSVLGLLHRVDVPMFWRYILSPSSG
jgi:hypothetical protein